LFTAGCEFDFFQAVRLLALMKAERHPERALSTADVVRFRTCNSLSFPASAIASIEGENGSLPQMTITFLGLTGPEGALPSAYTELVIDQACFGDRAFGDFLDIFNHRLIELFFETWKKHHFVVGYEQSLRVSRELDDFTGYLFDLIGLGTSELQGRLPVSDVGLLHYAGLLAQRPHSADALRAILHDYFQIPVTVEQLVGEWHTLENEELCRLGADEPTSQLGLGAVSGDAVWSRQALLRVVLGPLTGEQFRDFLPDGQGFAQASALVRLFLGNALEFALQPTLARGEVPSCKLGGLEVDGARLGWSAWLKTEPFWFDARDAIFAENEQVRQEA
jgi:type VI secretion system protein ImpH